VMTRLDALIQNNMKRWKPGWMPLTRILKSFEVLWSPGWIFTNEGNAHSRNENQDGHTSRKDGGHDKLHLVRVKRDSQILGGIRPVMCRPKDAGLHNLLFPTVDLIETSRRYNIFKIYVVAMTKWHVITTTNFYFFCCIVLCVPLTNSLLHQCNNNYFTFLILLHYMFQTHWNIRCYLLQLLCCNIAFYTHYR
jgi:hypothetical protein